MVSVPEPGRMTFGPLEAGPYTIPSGHILIPIFTPIMVGEDEWEEANEFNPGRFLKDGKLQKDKRVIPFSIGKRVCPGEALAKAELFLFLTVLLQKFKFESAHLHQKVEVAIVQGFLKIPVYITPIKVTKILNEV